MIHAAIGMRHMLLILDDAWEAEAAFTPKVGGPNCAYLVTTRHMDLALDFTGKNVSVIRELEQNDGLELLLTLNEPWTWPERLCSRENYLLLWPI